jgi:hypothetical protein
MAGTTAEAWIGQPIELWVELANGQLVSGTLEGWTTRGLWCSSHLKERIVPSSTLGDWWHGCIRRREGSARKAT